MSEKCKRCGRAKHMGRCKKADIEKVSTSAPSSSTPTPTPAVYGSAGPVSIAVGLEVEASLGFRASIENGALCLEQDRPDADDGKLYTHSLVLSPHEARKLVDWVAERVEDQAA